MSGTRQRKHVSKGEKSFLSVPAAEPWAWLTRTMLESPAWRALTRAGSQLLWRVVIENLKHGGKENGRLAVSYDAIEDYGVHRSMIKGAINELIALGFIRQTRKGRRAYGNDPGQIALYRLTFFGVVGDDSGYPSNEWQNLSEEHVDAISRRLKAEGRRKLQAPSDDPQSSCNPLRGNILDEFVIAN